jgi:YfiH family protein
VSIADEVLRPGDVPLWEVPGWRERWGITAGITGRGDPAAPFDLGLWTDQPVGAVMSRWRTFRRQFPECPATIMAHQVHQDTVLWHAGTPPGWTIFDGADGHATVTPGELLLVTVADCVPIYLLAPQSRAIALLHAGWRGTAAGILSRGLELLASRTGTRTADIVMHLGVAICGGCYEVGSEVLAAVGEPARTGGRGKLDLRAVLAEQGAKLGIGETTQSGLCTSCHRDRFFSHRASGGTDGRMIAYLGTAC